jgi:ligand-binding sensor domain-containing protein
VLLFEMLAGRVPFEAETPMAVLFKQIQDPPPPLTSVRPDLHYSLEAVLLRALAKDPADRYPSMHAFLSAWKSAYSEASTPSGVLHAPVMAPEVIAAKQSGMPSVASIQPDSGSVPVVLPAKRNFRMAVMIPLALLFCLVAGAVFVIFGLRVYRSRQTSARVPAPARTQQPVPGQTAPVEIPVTPAGAAASWSGANTVYAIAFNGDSVLAAGEGGITIWNRKDGSSKQISTAGGLPGGVVLSILVDNDGSIWAGTDNGLAHLNASQQTVYSAADGLDSEYIITLARSGGRLFAGTQYSSKQGGGLLELNGASWQPVAGFPSSDKPAAGLVSSNVRQVVVDAHSNVWVATEQGIARLDDKNQWTVFSSANGLQDENIYTIYADRSNDIFAGAANGVVEKFNPDKGVFESYATLSDRGLSDVYGILQDKNGNLWFSGGVVARFDPSTKTWTNFGPTDGSFPASSARALAMDDRGDLYFGTYEQGLVHFSNAKFDTRMVPNRPRFGEYDRIIPAPGGKLVFVQVYASGADEFDPAGNLWTAVPSEQNVPRAFDAHGQMWSGGWDGLWIFGAGKTTHLSTDLGLPSNQVNAVVFGADGTAYIATAAGIAVFDGATVTDVYGVAKNGLASDEVSTLFMATDGSLWAGTSGGFSRRQPDGKWQNFTAQGLFGGFADSFPAFAQDHDGNIWVATNNDGVYRFSNGAWKRLRSTDPGVGLPSDDITSITVAPDGALWFGSNGQGAVRFDGKAWKAYGMGDGLIDVHVNDIYASPDGSMWFTTGGGISHLTP